jgi:hypothetical protein
MVESLHAGFWRADVNLVTDVVAHLATALQWAVYSSQQFQSLEMTN